MNYVSLKVSKLTLGARLSPSPERQRYWRLATERLTELHLQTRSDAVRAVEVILIRNSDAFPGATAHQAVGESNAAWVRDSQAFVQQQFGEKNVVSLTLHQDSPVPHLHCVVVPVTEGGQLSYRSVFSPSNLRRLRSAYAKAMRAHL